MVSSVLDRLKANGRIAVDTARCVAKLGYSSGLDSLTRDRLREGVEKRQWELSQIMDQLVIRDSSPDAEQILKVAKQAERLWHDIAKRLGANDDLKIDRRKAA